MSSIIEYRDEAGISENVLVQCFSEGGCHWSEALKLMHADDSCFQIIGGRWGGGGDWLRDGMIEVVKRGHDPRTKEDLGVTDNKSSKDPRVLGKDSLKMNGITWFLTQRVIFETWDPMTKYGISIWFVFPKSLDKCAKGPQSVCGCFCTYYIYN